MTDLAPRFVVASASLSTSSLRAKRSNPESLRGRTLDCFVACAPRNDGERLDLNPAASRSRRSPSAYAGRWRRRGWIACGCRARRLRAAR
ncbi:hypothetical protein GPL20_22135 [Bradyrhizobium cajani]|uniref:Uncharacterized protein n=1 Tax=Bradyrhizobium cajani TaxID=1928661 RepID=A0A844T9C7_9BRAD|nr:hypothetical protein [Bradyrhizobium cajani]